MSIAIKSHGIFFVENYDDIVLYSPEELQTSTHHSDGYHYMSGTSMSTPYVTGVAVLLLCENPNLTVAEMKSALINGGDTITIALPDGENQTVVSLNAFKAIQVVHVTHRYTTWHYYSSTQHIEKCVCGHVGTCLANHVVSASDTGARYKTCLGCHARLLITDDDMSVIQGVGLISVTENGSYMLPNGMIVLVEEDVAQYLCGQLLFTNLSETCSE